MVIFPLSIYENNSSPPISHILTLFPLSIIGSLLSRSSSSFNTSSTTTAPYTSASSDSSDASRLAVLLEVFIPQDFLAMGPHVLCERIDTNVEHTFTLSQSWGGTSNFVTMNIVYVTNVHSISTNWVNRTTTYTVFLGLVPHTRTSVSFWVESSPRY